MPPKARISASSDTVYASRPRLNQRTFPTRRRTTRSFASSSASSDARKQQTLTQIKFPIFLSDDEVSVDTEFDPFNDASESVQDTDEWQEEPRRKRRRVDVAPGSGKTTKKRSRNSGIAKEEGQHTLTQAGYLKRMALDSMDEADEDEVQIWEDNDPVGSIDGSEPGATNQSSSKTEELDVNAVLRQTTPAAAGIPEDVRPMTRGKSSKPQTPRHRKIMEVPSSQSPPDAPLSTQSNRFSQRSYRSPLKGRSVNIISSASTRSTKIISPEPVSPSNDAIPIPSLHLALTTIELDAASGDNTLVRINTVQDSDDEVDANDVSPTKSTSAESFAGNGRCTALETQDEAYNLDSPQHIASSMLPHPDWNQLEQREITQLVYKFHDDDDDGDDRIDDVDTDEAPVSSLIHSNSLKGDPTAVGSQGLAQQSDVDGASAQLLRDLHQRTQHQTTSNISSTALVAGRHIITQLPTNEDDSMHSAAEVLRQSQVSTIDITQATPRTQGAHPTFSSPRTQQRAAAYTHATQKIQTSPILPPKSAQSSPVTSGPIQIPSSPLAMPPPYAVQEQQYIDDIHESAIRGGRDKQDGRRVTFSQLVPESLRHESFPMGPIWTQDDDD